jgi:hypothetical protein
LLTIYTRLHVRKKVPMNFQPFLVALIPVVVLAYPSVAEAQTWHDWGGCATSLDAGLGVGATDQVLVTGCDPASGGHHIFSNNSNSGWNRYTDGSGTKISVNYSLGTAALVNQQGDVFVDNQGNSGPWINVTSGGCGSWVYNGENDALDRLFVVGCSKEDSGGNGIYYLDGTTWVKQFGQGKIISGAWLINDSDHVYTSNDFSVASAEAAGITWTPSGTGLDGDCALSVAAGSQVFAVGCDNHVYQWLSGTVGWSALLVQPSAGASQVSVDGGGNPWIIDNTTSQAVWGLY